MQNKSITTLYHVESQKIMLCKTVTWNDMKFQRSQIVFNDKSASYIKDQARHVVLVVACYKAQPRGSKSRQSNESTVDSSCTSLESTKLALKNTPQRKLWKPCSKKARDYLDSAKKHNYGRIVARDIEDEEYRMRMQEQGDTQSDMEEVDRIANAK